MGRRHSELWTEKFERLNRFCFGSSELLCTGWADVPHLASPHGGTCKEEPEVPIEVRTSLGGLVQLASQLSRATPAANMNGKSCSSLLWSLLIPSLLL